MADSASDWFKMITSMIFEIVGALACRLEVRMRSTLGMKISTVMHMYMFFGLGRSRWNADLFAGRSASHPNAGGHVLLPGPGHGHGSRSDGAFPAPEVWWHQPVHPRGHGAGARTHGWCRDTSEGGGGPHFGACNWFVVLSSPALFTSLLRTPAQASKLSPSFPPLPGIARRAALFTSVSNTPLFLCPLSESTRLSESFSLRLSASFRKLSDQMCVRCCVFSAALAF